MRGKTDTGGFQLTDVVVYGFGVIPSFPLVCLRLLV